VSAPTPGRALDLEAIEATLQDLQLHFPEINKLLKSRRDTIDDGLIANMMTGYELVDNLVTRHLDLFAMGNLKLFLEMNAVVLCGRDEQSRTQAASHLAATEQRFYEQEDGGIRDIVEWYELHRAKSPWERAAGVYVRMLSEPELFIEGNHRTGALVMSYILGARGSPFVLTAANAKAYLDPSTLITETRKHSLVATFRLPKIKRYFAKFLKEHSDRKYLIASQTGGARR
jgi:prophage maintenance system killer protein